MSKLDAQRAMREANYARNKASGSGRSEASAVGGTPAAPARAPRTKPARAVVGAPGAIAKNAPVTEGARCGHKSMNGRACTREAAHPEKNHRYS
ncbi:MAG TPA: hypothetical protein VGK18_10440 [Propionicimonas sp.]|jgi:hypothetical protein|uniref:hypothetical protein n=1 Tax=Propionicimonas sp. TaxID=1955623 RepID=UPI002F41B4C8